MKTEDVSGYDVFGCGRCKRSPLPDNRGFALVLTLMVVAIITAMVVEFAYGVYINTSALYNWQNSQKLSYAARSAIKLGAMIITENAKQYPYTYPGSIEITKKIPFDNIDGSITLKIEDENSKFNVNSLVFLNGTLNEDAYASFVRLLKALNLKTSIADNVVSWINPAIRPMPVDSKIPSKNTCLDSVDELLLIPGIDMTSYTTLLPYVTIYGSGQGSFLININGASVPVLMSLSDSIGRGLAENIVRYRESSPFQQISDIQKVSGINIGTIKMQYITVKGTSFYVTGTAQSGDIQRIIDCVLDVSGTGTNRIVRYWKEL